MSGGLSVYLQDDGGLWQQGHGWYDPLPEQTNCLQEVIEEDNEICMVDSLPGSSGE